MINPPKWRTRVVFFTKGGGGSSTLHCKGAPRWMSMVDFSPNNSAYEKLDLQIKKYNKKLQSEEL